MSARLSGKTALVTGATSNIGRAIAVALGREGALVAVHGRDERRAADVVAEIEAAGGRALALISAQDGSAEAARQLAREATERLGGRVDVLVNNAGIYPAPATPETDEATFDRVMGVNVKAPFFLTGALAPQMARQGGGAIINLGSWIARLAVPVGSLYSSTKGAVETLTRAWAAEFGPSGVRVNAISPGVVHEPSDRPLPGDALMHGTPAGTFGPPEAIGAAAVYLASDEARFVHGAVLDVDGGRTSVAVVRG